MKAGKSGITNKTPENILFGAGTIHKGLKFEGGTWNFAESLVGATSGGSKLSIIAEVTPIELDGADVKVIGLNVKTGESGSMEINFAELTKDLIKAALIAQDGTSDVEGFDLIETKPNIEEGDYWENIAFVGVTVKGQQVIVIMENALCTSGLELEGKAKEAGIATLTFECHAAFDSGHDTLPIKIYYPKTTTEA